MKIELPDEILNKLGLDEAVTKEILAVALYKIRGIHGAMAGKLLGISEYEFHGLLGKYGLHVNYDVADFEQDLRTLRDLDP